MQLFTVYFLFLAVFSVPSAKASFVLEILLVSYQNPNHRLFDNKCCELDVCSNHCDNAFIICVRLRESDFCDFGSFRTGRIAYDNDNLVFDPDEAIGHFDMPNPIVITGDEWSEEFEFTFTIFDVDGGHPEVSESSEHVASFLIRPSEYPLINGELSDVYSYVNHTSTLRLAYNLTCNPESHCFVYSNNSTPYSSSAITSSEVRMSTVTQHTTLSPTTLSLVPTQSPSVMSSSPLYYPDFTDPKLSTKEPIPLSVSLAVNCIVIITVLTAIIVIIMVVCMRRRYKKKRRTATIAQANVSFKPELDEVGIDDKNEEHVYDTINTYTPVVNPRMIHTSITDPPYAIIDPMSNVIEDDDDAMKLKTNVAYDILKVERNDAYTVTNATFVRQSTSRSAMPLPNVPPIMHSCQ